MLVTDPLKEVLKSWDRQEAERHAVALAYALELQDETKPFYPVGFSIADRSQTAMDDTSWYTLESINREFYLDPLYTSF